VTEEAHPFEPVSFEQLYRSERDAMVRLAYLMTGSVAVAEELVHDTFLRVEPRLAGLATPRAYLRRSVINACRSWHRRRHRELAVIAEPVAIVAEPEHDAMWDALGRLAPRRRAVLVLRYYLDLPEAEVAATLGWRLGTVKSVTHRALGDLRKVLERTNVIEP
jgi:RNA polymerase sigma factor (sigma-70 family)